MFAICTVALMAFGLAPQAQAATTGLAFTAQPQDVLVAFGNSATFSATATDTTYATVNYQWQYLVGSTWTDFPDGNFLQTGVAKNTVSNYTLNTTLSEMDGLVVHVLITDASNNSVASDAVTLHVASITSAPEDQTVVSGGNATFAVSYSGVPSPSVVWQYSSDGGTTYHAFGGGTAIYSNGNLTSTLTTNAAADAADGYMFRAAISSSTIPGSTIYTSWAHLYVIKLPVINSTTISGTGISNNTAYHGQTVVLTVNATSPSEANEQSGAISVVWYQGACGTGTLVPDGSSASVSLPNVESSAAGSYCALVTNTVGSYTTTATGTVTLTIIPGFWKNAGSLASGVETFTRAALLPNGHAIAIGSDFNDPTDVSNDAHSATINVDANPGVGLSTPDTWTAAGASLTGPLQRPTMTLLPTGDLLIAGGMSGTTDQAATYLFNEGQTGTVAAAGSLNTARDSHTASLLFTTGQVLVAGGSSAGAILKSAELYDPASQTWTATGAMNSNRFRHTATVLQDGTVLVTGGQSSNSSLSVLNTAELYDPVAKTWTLVGPMRKAREYQTATLLADGTVLIAGGIGNTGATLNSAEIYNPVSKTFSDTNGQMVVGLNQHTATLLPNGKVLLAGGASAGTEVSTAMYYDPGTGTFTQLESMISARDRAAALLARDGKVLEIGGTNSEDSVDVSINATEKLKDETQTTPPVVPDATIAFPEGENWVTATTPATATCGGSTPQPNVTYTWTILHGVITAGQGTNSITFEANNGDTTSVALYCLATSNVGIPGAGTANLPIGYPPVITMQPSNDNILAGAQGSFTVKVTGYPPPATIQWQYSSDGGATFHAFGGGSAAVDTADSITTSTLTTNNAPAAADGYMFQAMVSNTVGAGTASAPAELRVNAVPQVSVSVAPVSGNIDQNGSVTFQATVTGDVHPTYSYQWTGPSGPVGTNSPTLTIPSAQAGDTGNYSVAVTNTNVLSGTDDTTQVGNSTPLSLQVYTPATFISGADPASVLAGNSAMFTVNFSGYPAPTVVWQYSADGVNFRTFGGGSVANGSGTSTLTTNPAPAAANGYTFRAVISNNTTLDVPVSNTSNSGLLTVVSPPTGLTVTPTSESVPQGGTITLTASSTAAGNGQTVNYVWCTGEPSNTVPCASQVGTGATLTISNALLANGGSYYVQATDVSTTPTGTTSAPTLSDAIPVTVDVGTWSLVDGNLQSPRYDAMSLMLPNGKFWIAGGMNDSGLLSNDDLYTPTGQTGWAVSSGNGVFTAGPHLEGTATLLPNNTVLIAGGSDGQDGKFGMEIYNPTTQAYATDNVTLAQPTTQQVAALLPNQSVLLAGGSNGWSDTFYNTAYLYTVGSTPGTNDSLAPSNAHLSVGRAGARSLVLGSGRVLILGGQDAYGVDNAVDIYDSSPEPITYDSQLYTTSGSAGDEIAQANCSATPVNGSMCMASPRLYHTATLLNDGRVLVIGGTDNEGVLGSIEIWDPTLNGGMGGFSPDGALATARMAHSAVLLENGDVLVFGGEDGDGNALSSAEVVDPNWQTDLWPSASIPASSQLANRLLAASTSLPNGNVLTAGGINPLAEDAQTFNTSEIFHALEGYSSALPETFTLNGAGSAVTPNSTGNVASVTGQTPGYFTNYSWSVTNGTITSGQGTSSITYTAGSGLTETLSVQVTDQYGQSQVLNGTTPPPTCAQPTASGIHQSGMSYNNFLGNYSVTRNSTVTTYLQSLSTPGGSSYTISWSASGGGFSATSTNGTSTSGDKSADGFAFKFGSSTGFTPVTLTATVNVTCSNTVTSSKSFTLSPIYVTSF
jgi:hypothetical protein